MRRWVEHRTLGGEGEGGRGGGKRGRGRGGAGAGGGEGDHRGTDVNLSLSLGAARQCVTSTYWSGLADALSSLARSALASATVRSMSGTSFASRTPSIIRSGEVSQSVSQSRKHRWVCW